MSLYNSIIFSDTSLRNIEPVMVYFKVSWHLYAKLINSPATSFCSRLSPNIWKAQFKLNEVPIFENRSYSEEYLLHLFTVLSFLVCLWQLCISQELTQEEHSCAFYDLSSMRVRLTVVHLPFTTSHQNDIKVHWPS